MSLAPGTRLGPYEIGSLIGAGGMGEVYRATDTNLKRAVAIKVLPEALVADHERLARFQREAEVLASLNHPHIAQIHGLEKSATRIGLVMELVEGPTLADRITQGAIPLREAIPIAHQIAQALEAAHEQGIVHRDLKPANVKVRDDGTVKVLDFGLAKVAEPAAAGSSTMSLSPTITTPAMTQVGLILGTAAYMSPEQAKGRPADKRSDVWAFGCVLYEMLTGRRAFEGEDTSDTLASVLKSDPDWTALPTDVPPAIRTLIQRCLAKDRRHRISDVSVASFILTETATLGVPGASSATAAPIMTRRPVLLPVAIAVIATAVTAALAAWGLGLFQTERSIARFTFTLPPGQRFPDVSRQVLAMSPNGQFIAYVAGNRLHIKSMSEFEPRVVTGLEFVEGTTNPVFSPDSEWIAFYSAADRSIRRISRTGGASSMICPSDFAPFGMTWEKDSLVFGLGPRGVFRCPATGGKAEQLATVADGENAHGAQLLPGSDWMVFSIAKEADQFERWDKATIVAQSLSSGERRTLIEGGADARYIATGHLLFAVSGVVFAVRFDPADPKVTGTRAPVLEGVRRAVSATTGGAQFGLSMSGTLAYVPGAAQASGDSSLVLADRAGNVTPLPVPPDRYVHTRASPDGKRVAVDTDDGKEADVHTYELAATGGLNRLTFGGRNLFPVWSHDSQRLAFQSDRHGDRAIFAQRVDGTGLVRLTTASKEDAHIPESWSPDGKNLVFSVLKDATYTLWILSLADGKTTRFGDVVSSEPIGAVFAPNGRWVSYHSLPPGANATDTRSGVFVEPFPPNGTRYQPPKINRDFHPVWSPDGTELLWVASTASGRLETVQVTMTSGIGFDKPQSFPFLALAARLSTRTRAFDVLPDGRFTGLVSGTAGTLSPNSEMRIVLNWHEELKRLVPVN
jgi:Tol biopolymer transport system component